ncbi:MAG: hypothetical protein ABW205_10565 [Burkholderiales bacterium]
MTHAPENAPPAVAPTPLGSIEPHSGLLAAPPAGQSLYKVMSVENCLRSITGRSPDCQPCAERVFESR